MSKPKRPNKASVSRVAKAILPSENSSDNLAATVLQQAAELPWHELYPERKLFLNVVKSECQEEFRTLVSSLCDKYSEMLKLFRGKYAFLDLQIQWHQFIRSVATCVEIQATEDAQFDPAESEEPAINSPVANAWLSIVTAVISHDIPNKATQFAILHQFANCIYLHQHAKALETTMVETETEPGATEDVGDENNMVTLIRMCGSQLHGTYKKKLNECKRARQKNVVEEQLAIIDNICMNQQEKALAQAYLPICDEGGMRFPRREFFPFLKEFDSVVRSELNYNAFCKHGKKLFQASIMYIHIHILHALYTHESIIITHSLVHMHVYVSHIHSCTCMYMHHTFTHAHACAHTPKHTTRL